MKMIIMLLGIVTMFGLPCLAAVPCDYDVNGDGKISSVDALMAMQQYGTYEHWHGCDFNRDFIVDANDVQPILEAAAHAYTLAGCGNGIYVDTVYINETPITKVNQTNFFNWMNNWNQVDTHTWSYPYYQCGQFSKNVHLSFVGDYGYKGVYGVVDLGGHAYNAIFTGDNPLSIHDWIFVEPQDDRIIPYASRSEGKKYSYYFYIMLETTYQPYGATSHKEIWFVNDTGHI